MLDKHKRALIDSFHERPVVPRVLFEGYDNHKKKKPTDYQEFILFFKPEITLKSIHFETVLNLFFDLAKQHHIELVECIYLPTSYVKKHQLIEKNYSMLNKIAHMGVKGWSKSALERLNNRTPEGWKENPVFGGYEFLQNYNYFCPESLSVAINNLPTEKLSYGNYATFLKIFDEPVTILNAFHPFQVESLSRPDAAIIAFRCLTKKSWKEMRAEFVGAINPSQAKKNSLRYTFWKNQKTLKIVNFSTAFNGFHVSAGPVEAIHQYELFFGKSKSNTLFWREMIKKACPEKINQINAFTEVMLKNGKQENLYDYTEDVDMNIAISIIQKGF